VFNQIIKFIYFLYKKLRAGTTYKVIFHLKLFLDLRQRILFYIEAIAGFQIIMQNNGCMLVMMSNTEM